jgi:hypothetical protein
VSQPGGACRHLTGSAGGQEMRRDQPSGGTERADGLTVTVCDRMGFPVRVLLPSADPELPG